MSAGTTPADAKHHRHHKRHVARHTTGLPHGSLVTVPTAAGIRITVAASVAPRFQGFISDIVAAGYRPRHIGCYASGGHVPNSRHYAGAACDFDQSGWGRTASFMYHVRAIASAHGLRDGCSFRDCGHIDDGLNLHRWALRGAYGRGRSRQVRSFLDQQENNLKRVFDFPPGDRREPLHVETIWDQAGDDLAGVLLAHESAALMQRQPSTHISSLPIPHFVSTCGLRSETCNTPSR